MAFKQTFEVLLQAIIILRTFPTALEGQQDSQYSTARHVDNFQKQSYLESNKRNMIWFFCCFMLQNV